MIDHYKNPTFKVEVEPISSFASGEDLEELKLAVQAKLTEEYSLLISSIIDSRSFRSLTQTDPDSGLLVGPFCKQLNPFIYSSIASVVGPITGLTVKLYNNFDPRELEQTLWMVVQFRLTDQNVAEFTGMHANSGQELLQLLEELTKYTSE